MRNLIQVIEEIIPNIPPEETDLIEKLEDRKDSVAYTSPELMQTRWKEVAYILHAYMGNLPLNEEWKKEIYKIWMNL